MGSGSTVPYCTLTLSYELQRQQEIPRANQAQTLKCNGGSQRADLIRLGKMA
jgi:hypothetical protein